MLRLAAASLVLLGVPLRAQMEMPVGVFRGSLAAASGGDITIHSTQGTDLLCHYDSHSFAERDHRRIAIPSIEPGEPVEILADHKPGSQSCYSRMVLVIDLAAEQAALEGARQNRNNPVRPFFFTPTGDRTIAGVVVRLTSRLLMLRTRTGDTALALRPDTRYIDEGMRADPDELRVNTRVFVRAGRSLEGIVEAYQVMWGSILAAP